MLKIILTLLVVMISVYWIGEKARRNQKIDEFLSIIEGNYSKLNHKLEDSTIINGLRFLRKLYGYFTLFLVVSLLVIHGLGYYKIKKFILFSLFFSFMGWFSIKWVTDHKNTIIESLKHNVLIILGPFFMGLIEIIFGIPFTGIFAEPIRQIIASLHFNAVPVSNPIVIGSITSFFVFVFFCFNYLNTWIISVPVFLISVFAVLLPINLARLLAAIDKNNTFLWFTVIAMAVITVWLTQL